MSDNPSPDCPHEQARQALIAANSADPRQSPFGFFSSDDFVGGAGAHQWYPDIAALRRALVHDLPFAFCEDDPEAVADLEQDLITATAAMTTIEALGTDGLVELAKSLNGLQQLCWIGTFDELRKGNTDWALRMRSQFRENQELDLPETPAVDDPISDEHLEEFIDFLANFGM